MPETWLAENNSVAGRLMVGAADAWRAYTQHRFVAGLADGTLPEACFKHYLVQDYLFLVHFARAWALAAFKSDDIRTIRECTAVVDALVNDEMKLHIDYCADFGLSEAVMAATAEETENLAYTRFVIERGMAGDLLDLLVALAPCVVGYGEIGKRLMADPRTKLEGNRYRAWIEMYAGDEYASVANGALDQLDRIAAERIGSEPWTSPRWMYLQKTFEQATKLEVGFWDMAIKVE